LLKPNVSTLVGSLYDKNDDRRDAGFSIFYMGINLGAFLGPLIAGYLAERVDWHVGFAAAGIGMSLGLLQYILGRKPLKEAEARIKAVKADTADGSSGGLQFSPAEWRRIGAVVVLFAFASVFWGAYEQGGSTLTLFADRFTQLTVFGIPFPASWFQSLPAILVFILAPIFAWLWLRLGPRNPSSPAKFAFGLFFVGLAFVVMAPAGTIAQTQGIRVSAWWLATSYFLQVVGEMCLSPVGLSVVTKLSPTRIVGLMMGVWFLATAVGNKLAGFAAGFFSSMPLPTLFGWVAGIALAAALLMFLLVKPVQKLMGDVN
jgi:POT family proton-dependent oligopeptide transporter